MVNYVINLKRSNDRLKIFYKRNKKYLSNIIRINAINGLRAKFLYEVSQVSKLVSALALKGKLMIKILNSKKNLKIL